ncbi:MAG TPA: hypothetical protein VF644_19770 [Pyrinomonadaceae bacterium]|jgi:hypothetical protein
MKIKSSVLSFALSVAFLMICQTSSVKASYWVNGCPTSSQLSGKWYSFSPTYRLCQTDYYTWNTTGAEESSWKSDPVGLLCSYRPWDSPGYTQARVYIPYPDSRQTTNARYFRWGTSSNYVMIGSVNQYNSYGWVYLNTITWSQTDRLKLYDVTINETKYSKHVDLDAFGVTCGN